MTTLEVGLYGYTGGRGASPATKCQMGHHHVVTESQTLKRLEFVDLLPATGIGLYLQTLMGLLKSGLLAVN
ncbi:hypothetical protein M378DRAFT_163013 [Amanita muscaria Koide BX008]|uniref:Uncharacterized protein n=1 Tax=Amanita muscaria (strain Koide BX008) TaxID=946122 RepID=A0A0C2SMX7_AMAMK|nr:hypothetical protein M378DRAFT_163013 [Amanita muscaria Koide BX008]